MIEEKENYIIDYDDEKNSLAPNNKSTFSEKKILMKCLINLAIKKKMEY